MSLTRNQLVTLREDILGSTDPAVIAALGGGAVGRDDTTLAAIYNAASVPAFWVWRTRVPLDEITQNGFDWVRVDNLSVGRARIWEWLFANQDRSINPSKANVRAGIAECWKGTAADVAVQTAVLGHCRRQATRAERLFATGTGSTEVPGDAVFSGSVAIDDIGRAMNPESAALVRAAR